MIPASDLAFVIPAKRRKAARAGIHNHDWWLWIPALALALGRNDRGEKE
jgi:hypothetical protein